MWRRVACKENVCGLKFFAIQTKRITVSIYAKNVRKIMNNLVKKNKELVLLAKRWEEDENNKWVVFVVCVVWTVALKIVPTIKSLARTKYIFVFENELIYLNVFKKLKA